MLTWVWPQCLYSSMPSAPPIFFLWHKCALQTQRPGQAVAWLSSSTTFPQFKKSAVQGVAMPKHLHFECRNKPIFFTAPKHKWCNSSCASTLYVIATDYCQDGGCFFVFCLRQRKRGKTGRWEALFLANQPANSTCVFLWEIWLRKAFFCGSHFSLRHCKKCNIEFDPWSISNINWLWCILKFLTALLIEMPETFKWYPHDPYLGIWPQ